MKFSVSYNEECSWINWATVKLSIIASTCGITFWLHAAHSEPERGVLCLEIIYIYIYIYLNCIILTWPVPGLGSRWFHLIWHSLGRSGWLLPSPQRTSEVLCTDWGGSWKPETKKTKTCSWGSVLDNSTAGWRVIFVFILCFPLCFFVYMLLKNMIRV